MRQDEQLVRLRQPFNASSFSQDEHSSSRKEIGKLSTSLCLFISAISSQEPQTKSLDFVSKYLFFPRCFILFIDAYETKIFIFFLTLTESVCAVLLAPELCQCFVEKNYA